MRDLLEKLFPSLGKKVAVAVVVASLLAWGSFVFFAQRTGYAILETQAEVKAHGIITLMAGILDHAIEVDDSAQIRNVLRLAVKSPDIVDAFLVADDGAVLWRARDLPLPNPLPLQDFHDVPASGSEKYLTVKEHDSVYEYVISSLQPVTDASLAFASGAVPHAKYFALKVSMADLRALAAQHRTTNITMTVIIFAGLGILIYVALSILVLSPVRSLHSHIGKIESKVQILEHGEKAVFPLLAIPPRRDEIAELCKNFNHLVDRLNEANERLIEMHQSQLEHADRLAATGEMAASMAHEIKNPIAGVLGALQVFDSETNIDPVKKDIIGEMIVQLERVTHVVNDLLQYARPSSPVFASVDLKGLVEKTLLVLNRQQRGKEIAIHAELGTTPIIIFADGRQIQQVLWNVTLNAIQAIEKAGVITVRATVNAGSVIIHILDTGAGIPKDNLDKIFKPFFTTKHKGTGLGMTISRRIVEQHSGTLTVDSTVGEGTTVTIILPQQQSGVL